MDEDGYPTDETLARIRAWPWQDAAGCLDFVRKCWYWPDWAHGDLRPEERAVVHAEDGDRFARFATGGWSGNEDLIAALNDNRMVRALTWWLSSRSGLHIYKYPPTQGD